MENLNGIRFSEAGKRLEPPMITRLMEAALGSRDLLSLAAGFTDNATLPLEEVGKVVAELVADSARECLQYGTNQGRPGLRKLLARKLAEQDGQTAESLDPERIFVTNGSQQALTLASQVLCDPGDIVLVDRPAYFVYLDVLRGLGVRAVSLPSRSDGSWDVAGLEALLERLTRTGEIARVKAVYFQSYFGNPSGRMVTREEKAALAEVLARRGLRIPAIEDAAYRDLWYESECEVPAAHSMEEFAGFPCLYLGTLTKSFATGLKCGFGYCDDAEWLARILYLKGQHDFGTANFSQAILERVLAEGVFDAHLEKLRKSYAVKMRALDEVLVEEGLRERGWKWEKPEGGLYLWLEGPEGTDTRADSAFFERCLENGVLYVPGDLCFGDDPDFRFVRLSFGVLAEEPLREAGRRFARSV